MADRTYAWERVSAAKAGLPGWRWYSVERITGGHLVTGGVPDGVYKRGPRKGRPKCDIKAATRVVVTDEECVADEQRWEAENEKCHACWGEGKTIASTGPDGRTYRECRRCKGTGKPPAAGAV